MKFSVPTNWELDLLPLFSAPEITEVYGKLAEDFVGGGRNAYSLSNISRKRFKSYLQQVHSQNCEFNYLLNASCLAGKEFTRRGQQAITKLLDWLVECGVDSITVAIPYLAEIVKKRYPGLKIKVSVMAHVDSIEKAEFWQSLGISSLSLVHTKLNRNFNLLKQIRKRLGCELQLMANNHCLYNCPLEEYHELFASHGSQENNLSGNFMFDYCFLSCRLKKIQNPTLLISAPWIRPEDISVYENLGIDSIKLVDRRLTSPELTKIIRAYLSRKYEGNLLDLFPNLGSATPVNSSNILLKMKYFFRPFSANILMTLKMKKLLEKVEIVINNRDLDGFIDFFQNHNCQLLSCQDCGYCRRIAEKTVSIDKDYQNRAGAQYQEFKNALSSGKAFRYFGKESR